MRNLGVELRPRRLSELIGCDDIVSALRERFTSGRIPSTVVVTGPFSSGKTTLMRILSRAVQCKHAKVFGETCNDCLGADFDIEELNAADDTSVEGVRKLLEKSEYVPSTGRYRVYILDEVHRLSKNAMDALLKPTEEPHDHLLWLLGTSEPGKVPAVNRSRGMDIELHGMNEAGMRELIARGVKELGKKIDEKALVEELLRVQANSPRVILKAVESCADGRSPADAAGMAALGTTINPFTIAEAVMKGDWNEARKVLAKAKYSDAEAIQTVVGWKFRDTLLKTDADRYPLHAEACGQAIKELEHNTFRDDFLLTALAGALYRICAAVMAVKKKPVERAA